ncbi:MAG: SBBP repeat-containing protein, partial [Flavobacterium sp.]|nr:SBBP repeat-containing protein [Flavobacterium sp.]
MEETIPMSWTEEENTKKQVAINYTKIKSNVYVFEGDLNSSDKTIVIDPTPTRLWGTYYGGEGMEYPSDIKNDLSNNIYISGSSTSQNNIATSGTHQSDLNGARNLFIAKLDLNSNRIWGTFLVAEGGTLNSQSCRLAIDSNYNVYVTGNELNDSSMGTAGTFQEFKNNFHEGYLVKLNLNGIKQWGTYFGGNGNETVYAICLDSNENIYVAGQTFSTDFNTLPTAFQNTMNGSSDGFIIKFDTTGNRVW